MKIPKDKALHVAMGAAAVIVMLLALELAAWRAGAALALASTSLGVFYEFQQWWRREGAVEWQDAVATAAPGWIVWAGLELLKGAV